MANEGTGVGTGGIISGAIQGVSNIIGNIFGASSQNSTNKMNMAINKMNNEFNANEAEKARQFQDDQWRAIAEYNSPFNQRQRNIMAGLNPYMNIDSGQAGSASSPSAATSGSPGNAQPFRPDISGLGSAISTAIQLSNETKRNNADVQALQGQRNLADAQAQKTLSDVDWGRLSPAYKTWSQLTGIKRAQLGMDTDQAQLDNVRWTNSLIKAQRTGQLLDNKARRITNKYLDQSQQLQLDLTAQRYMNLVQEGVLTVKKAESEIANRFLTLARASGQRIDNKIASQTASSYIEALQTQYAVESESNKGYLPYVGSFGQYDYRGRKAATGYSEFNFSTRYMDKALDSVSKIGNAVGSGLSSAVSYKLLKGKGKLRK
ncbi:DNA pilot protein [Dipodfec virus UOA04_Rod_499]|nr:DNA pilot protein [Dipodfec virus UOA04_Rod_499]